MIDKKTLSERDICTKFITPALEKAGWDKQLQILDIPCVNSSNGDGFLFHDRTARDGEIEAEISLDDFPSPDQLWQKNIQILTVPPINAFGSVTEIIQAFGSREAYEKAIKELENELFKVA